MVGRFPGSMNATTVPFDLAPKVDDDKPAEYKEFSSHAADETPRAAGTLQMRKIWAIGA